MSIYPMRKNQANSPVPKDCEFSGSANIMDAMEREFRQIFCTEETLGFAKSTRDNVTGEPTSTPNHAQI